MRIKSIELASFRNYEHQKVTFGPLTNVFFGANAQGKTNILEAIYLMTCARSHRTGKDQDLILRGFNRYAITLHYETDRGVAEQLKIVYSEAVAGDPIQSRTMRQIFHNGIKLDRIGELMGNFHAVIFAPEDVMLVKEGPAGRRRFLDLMISQIKPLYFQNLQNYSRLLGQRNKLLKTLRERKEARQDTASQMMNLDIWDLSLARTAAAIIKQRQLFVKKLDSCAREALTTLSGQKEKLTINYRSLAGVREEQTEAELYEHILGRLKQGVADDILRGLTSQGPHRDDLSLVLNGTDLKPFASQGQQRSVVLALKLAELQILNEETGEKPVLLLDDVMSELDASRRACLLEAIRGHQVCITCTEMEHVDWNGALRLAWSRDAACVLKEHMLTDVPAEEDPSVTQEKEPLHVGQNEQETEAIPFCFQVDNGVVTHVQFCTPSIVV